MMNMHLKTVIELMQIPGDSCHEEQIEQRLRRMLAGLGVPERCMTNDATWRQSEYGGRTGNLIVRLDGHGRGIRRMLSTHMDTVPGAVGCKPRIKGPRVVNGAPDKALGADARAGCACLLAAARALLKRKGNHEPWTLAFFVQEELGLVGSRGLDVKRLGRPLPAMCFNFDGGDANELAYGVIGVERLNINISGVAAHASRPTRGISAAVIAAEALAELQRTGWNGVIRKSGREGTANLGILRGGNGSNVTMPELYGLAESRSFDRSLRSRIISVWKKTFRAAVNRNNARNPDANGRAGVTFTPGPIYDPYVLPLSAPVVSRARAAMAACGLKPNPFKHVGGMDCCHVVSKGIPAVGLGMGEYEAHSVREYLEVPQFLASCRLAEALVAV